jgi:hypothetical protein
MSSSASGCLQRWLARRFSESLLIRWPAHLLRCLSIFLVLILGLGGCASWLGPQEIEIPVSRLQNSVETKFPLSERYLDLFDVSLTRPRLSLQTASDRLVLALDARVAPPLLKKPWQGELVVSGGLRIDPARRAVMLADPRLENIRLGAATGGYTTRLARLGTALAEDLLSDMVLYTFAPDAFVVAGQRFVPTRITTRGNSLVVSFEPAR